MPDPSRAPESSGAPRGTAKHIRETGDVSTGDITVEDVPDVRVTTRATDSFRFHHGGGARAAEVQLRSMLEDFLLKSARKVTKHGFLVLSREGFDLTVSPDRNTITGYSTIHRERTWEQVRAGVASRIRSAKRRSPSGPPPESGPAVELADFGFAFDPATVHLTGLVRTSYARITERMSVSDEELDAAIREACADFAFGRVAKTENGCFEINTADQNWVVSPDCGSVFGVKNREAFR